MQGYVFILFLVFTTATTSSPIHNTGKPVNAHAEVIRDMIQFKRKLQHETSYPRYTLNNDENFGKLKDIDQDFNELEIIQLIPSIIDQMKLNRITKLEYEILRNVFGSLFQLIIEETHRRLTEPMNPVLKSLFTAQKYRAHHFDNDIHKNTMDTIMQKYDINDNDKLAMKLAMRINRKLSPSQRILTAAALLIHENSIKTKSSTDYNKNDEMRQMHKKRLQNLSINNRGDNSEKAMLSLELLNANEDKLMKRQKRSAIIDGSSSSDSDTNNGIDGEQMKRLSDLIGSEKDYSDDFYDQLLLDNSNSNEYGDSTYQDYAFDLTATNSDNEDDELLRNMYGSHHRSSASSNRDYDEYGTISELLQLAAKHSLRKQRNSDYLKLTKDQIGPVSIVDYYDDDI